MTFENDSWQLQFAAMSMTELSLQFKFLTSLCRFVPSFREVYYKAAADNITMLVKWPTAPISGSKRRNIFYQHELGVDPYLY